jgi:hypothetical protein
MGRERKRGKLSALNRLLRTGDASAFQVTVGDLARLASVRYVITLDTDTRLPRDAGRELAGCMAQFHPTQIPAPVSLDARRHFATLRAGVYHVTSKPPKAPWQKRVPEVFTVA